MSDVSTQEYSLRDLLNRGETLPSDKFYGIALGIVRELIVLHDELLCHGNLQDSTILFNNQFVPKLTSPINSTDKFKVTYTDRTAIYLAPEILKIASDCSFEKFHLSMETDIYALGVTFYVLGMIIHEFMSLEQIFLNYEEIINDVVNGTRPKIPKDWNEKLRKLINSCWTQEPIKRPDIVNVLSTLQRNPNIMEKEQPIFYSCISNSPQLSSTDAPNQQTPSKKHSPPPPPLFESTDNQEKSPSKNPYAKPTWCDQHDSSGELFDFDSITPEEIAILEKEELDRQNKLHEQKQARKHLFKFW